MKNIPKLKAKIEKKNENPYTHVLTCSFYKALANLT